MELKITGPGINELTGGALVVPIFEGETVVSETGKTIDATLAGGISQLIQSGEIKGKYRETNTIFSLGKLGFARVVTLGLGKKSEINLEKIRTVFAETARLLRRKNAETVYTLLPAGYAEMGLEALVQAIGEGAGLGTYTFRRHFTKAPEYKELREFNLVIEDEKQRGEAEMGLNSARIISEAVILARDLANEPANKLSPSDLAAAAARVAAGNGLEIKMIEKEEMQSLGMGGLLGVAQGSVQPPKFIILTYRGGGEGAIDIALVGKGITFDSGGISLKPSDNMGEMKGDMAGAADVIAAIGAIARLKPAINVIAIAPATENMPGGSALKPGDVITIMNGKTVEIISTDAEGRLILADAVCYAQKMGARKIVDVATLTGSCHIALGEICSGVFGNNQEFIDQMIKAGQETGECMWQLPMHDEYRELNHSDVADVKNSGGRYGGASSAAWFIREFVESAPWIHLDIAGTSTTNKERGYLIKGNTGIPVRTLIRLVLNLAALKSEPAGKSNPSID